jgi:hypothetical protein
MKVLSCPSERLCTTTTKSILETSKMCIDKDNGQNKDCPCEKLRLETSVQYARNRRTGEYTMSKLE